MLSRESRALCSLYCLVQDHSVSHACVSQGGQYTTLSVSQCICLKEIMEGGATWVSETSALVRVSGDHSDRNNDRCATCFEYNRMADVSFYYEQILTYYPCTPLNPSISFLIIQNVKLKKCRSYSQQDVLYSF